MELHVTNLDNAVTNGELRRMFSPYGKVVSARIFVDCYTRQRREFGFVRMSTDGEGRKAIRGMHGKVIHDRPLDVSEVHL